MNSIVRTMLTGWGLLRNRFEHEIREPHIAQWRGPGKVKSAKITTTISAIDQVFTGRYRGYMSGITRLAVKEDMDRLKRRDMLRKYAISELVDICEIEEASHVIMQIALSSSGRIDKKVVLSTSGMSEPVFNAGMLYLDECLLLDANDKELLSLPVIASLVTDHWLMVLDRCDILEKERVLDESDFVIDNVIERIRIRLKETPRIWLSEHEINKKLRLNRDIAEKSFGWMVLNDMVYHKVNNDGITKYKHKRENIVTSE
jgi:hypothetical protein